MGGRVDMECFGAAEWKLTEVTAIMQGAQEKELVLVENSSGLSV